MMASGCGRATARVFEQCDSASKCVETAIGITPTADTIDLPAGVSTDNMKELLSVDVAGWKKELADIKNKHYAKFDDKLPQVLTEELDALEARLNN